MKITYIITILILGGMFSITINPVFALSCAGPAFQEEFENSDAVFIGVVDEQEIDSHSGFNSYTVTVEQVFKGNPRDTVKIKSDLGFGIILIENWRYLIFANDMRNHFKIDLCTRSDIVPPIPNSDEMMKQIANHNIMMLDIVLMDTKPAPLKQLQKGVWYHDVMCNLDLVLIGKIDGTPVCVKESSIKKLVERGWANPYYAGA